MSQGQDPNDNFPFFSAATRPILTHTILTHVHKFIDFLTANWDSVVGFGGTIAGISGWLAERKKRMRDNRDADVLFWEKTIDRQNLEISRLEDRIKLIEQRYEEQIQRLLARIAEHNGLPVLSMGMSGDFELGIAMGATHIRVGSALFGYRPKSNAQ